MEKNMRYCNKYIIIPFFWIYFKSECELFLVFDIIYLTNESILTNLVLLKRCYNIKIKVMEVFNKKLLSSFSFMFTSKIWTKIYMKIWCSVIRYQIILLKTLKTSWLYKWYQKQKSVMTNFLNKFSQKIFENYKVTWNHNLRLKCWN